jgi:nitrite reductase/ring-hydroxylating ferredoxin subunit
LKQIAKVAKADVDKGPLRIVYPPCNVVVVRDSDTYFAMEDACNHSGASLSRGWVADHCLICPAHAYAFDLKTGALLRPKGACGPQKIYQVTHEGDELVIWDTFDVLVQLSKP